MRNSTTLHSTMFLLIQFSTVRTEILRIFFTFHDVSINTSSLFNKSYVLTSLHSTMFLLILFAIFHRQSPDLTLHSTMFLLIRIRLPLSENRRDFTFHDVSINTMANLTALSAAQVFTFHDVSINTRLAYLVKLQICTLHSTMFLLIRLYRPIFINHSSCFTFHDVSINTISLSGREGKRRPLHSTMFLLIR